MLSEAELEKELYNYAISLLARREQSERELHQKLCRKSELELEVGVTFNDVANTVIERLKDKGYLSNARYAQMLLRSRHARGYGPLRLQQELQQAGIESELIALSFEEFEEDWFESACRAREKRFGLALVKDDIKLKAKQVRFLSSRGFTSEQVNYAMQKEEEL